MQQTVAQSPQWAWQPSIPSMRLLETLLLGLMLITLSPMLVSLHHSTQPISLWVRQQMPCIDSPSHKLRSVTRTHGVCKALVIFWANR